MAEHSFQEVMHQFDRMCNAHSGCINCPLCQNDYYSDDECHIGAFVHHPEIIEQTVMQWAAENPEPVYPTWEEWLITQGVIKENPNGGVGRPMPKLFEPIPADVAQKLGIEPKEENQ